MVTTFQYLIPAVNAARERRVAVRQALVRRLAKRVPFAAAFVKVVTQKRGGDLRGRAGWLAIVRLSVRATAKSSAFYVRNSVPTFAAGA